MAPPPPLLRLLLLHLLLLPPLISSSDTLYLSSNNEVLLATALNTSLPILLSSDGAFAWQFAPYQTSQRILTITNTKYNTTIVWIANRDRPVSPNATLRVTNDSAIVLTDVGGVPSVVWSSPSGVANVLMNATGNLVMQDGRNETVWQSFDYATDVIVAGQALTPSHNATARISTDNISTGHYVLRAEPGGPVLYASFDQQQQNIPYAIITYAQGVSGTLENALHSSCNATQVIYNADGSGVSLEQVGNISAQCETETGGFTVHGITFSTRLGGEGFHYLRLMPTGDIDSFLDSSDGLKLDNELFRGFFSTYCKLPSYCSVNSICSSVQTCSCPDYFQPIDASDLRQGCQLSVPLNCSVAQEHQFSAVPGVDYYANAYMNATAVVDSSDNCTALCRLNCSCTAAFYNNQTGECHLYDQVQTLQSGANPSITAYLRVAHLNEVAAASSQVLSKNAIIGLSVGLGVLFVGMLLVGAIIGRKLAQRRRAEDEDSEEEAFLDSLPGLPPRYSFKELEAATEGFSKKLGKGGSSAVYEGVVQTKAAAPPKNASAADGAALPDGRGGLVKVAVKQLLASERATIAASGKKQFRQEVAALGTLSHVNLVQLRGFCAEGAHRLLIYEFMENGSLDRWIFQNSGGGGGGAASEDELAWAAEGKTSATPHVLPWEVRYRIATDTARGLAFLHEGSRAKVVHLDVKPQNILLDANFRAKLADFGLCKLIERTDGGETQTVTAMRGTPGYMAPEWFLNLPITEKSDIFSYGMVLLELVGGRKNLNLAMGSEDGWYFPAWAVKQAERGEVESIIDNQVVEAAARAGDEKARESMCRLIKVAFWCIQEDASARPAMSTILLMLERHVEVPEPPLDLTYVLRRQTRPDTSTTVSSGTTTSSGTNSTAAVPSRFIEESMSLLEPR